ncbi:MAG: hypothetical protein EBT08_20045 [Betaproteobacteria bacterium]|nr:hypothetical protein [Betaproteobacteria bacterium]
MTDLSPSAQAVLNAFLGDAENTGLQMDDMRENVAAALRAAADLSGDLEVPFDVVTKWEEIRGSCAKFYAAAEWGYNQALAAQRAIATELEGHG